MGFAIDFPDKQGVSLVVPFSPARLPGHFETMRPILTRARHRVTDASPRAAGAASPSHLHARGETTKWIPSASSSGRTICDPGVSTRPFGCAASKRSTRAESSSNGEAFYFAPTRNRGVTSKSLRSTPKAGDARTRRRTPVRFASGRLNTARHPTVFPRTCW